MRPLEIEGKVDIKKVSVMQLYRPVVSIFQFLKISFFSEQNIRDTLFLWM